MCGFVIKACRFSNMGEARFRLAFKSAFKEKPQWQTKEQPEREPSFPHLEQI
jgi:hypothetical protein